MSEHSYPRLKVKRRDAIADVVIRAGGARVAELAERFNVSPATIRRDLEKLEDAGRLKRVHGGAVAADQAATGRDGALLSSGQTASSAPSAEIARLGRVVADIIGEGETVFLAPGRLSLEVARALEGHPQITVVTSGLEIAHWLASHTGHRLIITGGQLDQHGMGLVGQLTRDALATLRADRVILELDGVSAVEGLTHDNLSQAEIAEMLTKVGSSIIVLVAPERVGRVAAAHVAPATSADIVVTSRKAPAAYLWDLSEVGVEIVLA